MEIQQKKIFANCSQTVRSHCEFRKVFADQFRIAKTNNPVHCSFAKISSHKTYAKFRIAKFTMNSQSQFRNAKTNFAMPISISQCQYTVHLSQPVRNFALRNSQPTLRISQTHFALRNSLPLRNSHSQTHFRIAKFPAFAKFTFAGLVILSN